MLLGIASAIAWFGAFMAIQLLAFWTAGVTHRSRLIVRLFVLALAAHAVTVGWLGIGAQSFSVIASAACGVLLMMCLLILYMPFFYTLTTSLSVETLSMLEAAAGARLPVDEVRARFTSQAFVQDRLQTMQANGYFTADGSDGYRLSARGERTARLLDGVKHLLVLGTGG